MSQSVDSHSDKLSTRLIHILTIAHARATAPPAELQDKMWVLILSPVWDPSGPH